MSNHHRALPSKSRQVKAMQLFYEVKQQFPTVPDHTITSKISHHLQKNLPINRLLEVMREIVQQEEPMGRAQTKLDSPTLDNIQGLQNEDTEEDSKSQENKTLKNLNQSRVSGGKIKRGLSDFKKNNEVFSDVDDQSGELKNHTCETKSNPKKCKDNENNKQNKNIYEDEGLKLSINNINERPNSRNKFVLIKTHKMDDKTAEKENNKNENIVNEESCDKKESMLDLGKTNLDDLNKNCDIKPALAKRPNTLDFNSNKSKFKIQPSEKCTDVFTLLNSPNFNEKHPKALMSDKPPMSPLSAKRLLRNSPVIAKKETVSTPSQTTDTLLNNANLPNATNKVSTPCQTTDTLVGNCGSNAFSPSVNVSINCEMMQKPTVASSNKDNKCSAKLELTPTQPWINGNQPTSPRSFTSVNLTLRPPSSSPQDPIDITSQNSSMTYSTSSFDPKRGLQSRLQITVGPGSQSVTSMRTRPQSSYLPQLENAAGEGGVLPARANSLTSLENLNPEPPALLRQQARIDKMRIELRTGYARLVIMRKEVDDMKRMQREADMRRAQQEVEKQLRMEVDHLKFQVKQLNSVEEILLNNTYIGGYGAERQLLGNPFQSIAEPRPSRPAPAPPNPMRPVRSAPPAPTDMPFDTISRRPSPFQEIEGPKWNCSMCTFLNHPSLEHCEQCDMPRVLHGNNTIDSVANRLPTAAQAFNPLHSLPSTSCNVAEARNEFTSLHTNLNKHLNLRGQNEFDTQSSSSKTDKSTKILQSLQEVLINTTSLVALKDIQPQEKEKTDSLKMLKKSADVLKNFREQISPIDPNSNNINGDQCFKNFATKATRTEV